MSKLPRVAVLGATGAVGQEFIRLFEERNFQFASLKLLASKRSAGKKLMVCGKEDTVEEATLRQSLHPRLLQVEQQLMDGKPTF